MANGVKITFMGAGSTVFVKNVLGDCMYREALKDAEIALYDIDATRLKESEKVLSALNHSINDGRATVKCYLGTANRKKALKNTTPDDRRHARHRRNLPRPPHDSRHAGFCA